jgi:ABC-2 type transport system permease protein
MTNLIRAELLKLRTTRTFWAYVVASLAFVPVTIAQAVYGGSASLDSSEGVRHVMAAASAGGVMLLLIGILAMAGEFRHATATAAFLITPERRRVVAAKIAATAIVGACVGVAASLLTVAVGLPWLSAQGVDVGAHAGGIGLVLLGGVAATTLSAVGGVGFGALVPNQTVAITTALVWMFTVEGILVSFLPSVGRWLPGGASAAMTHVATAKGGLLPMWAGAVLFTAYALAFAAAGTRRIARRDIA